MSDYPIGTVATATVRGVEGVRVMLGHGTAEPRLRWLTTDDRLVDPDNEGWFLAYDVTDVRPLVVLDLDFPRTVVKHLRMAAENDGALTTLRWLADQIEEQTRPPRIPEPGLWGVVEASAPGYSRRGDWVRHRDGWRLGSSTLVRIWDDLIDPALVREGVTP